MKGNKRSILVSMLFVFLLCPAALAAPTTPKQAEDVVRGWLVYNNSAPFENPSGTFSRVESYGEKGEVPNSEALYYAVYLDPKGIILLPAEDTIEPVAAYLPNATWYGPEPSNPVFGLFGSNIAGIVKKFRQDESRAAAEDPSAREKWAFFQKLAGSASRGDYEGDHLPPGSSPAVWVTPFLEANWGQEFTVTSSPDLTEYAYNQYTPNNYQAGCGAVMMAEIMYQFKYPKIGIGTAGYTVTVDNYPEEWHTRGGDGYGGPYNWDLMGAPLAKSMDQGAPNAIGALMYDAAISIGSVFTSSETGSYIERIADALMQTFHYNNAMLARPSLSGTLDRRMFELAVNPNLEAGYPVGLGIYDGFTGAGHAVVADGYGYEYDKTYYHLVMGWGDPHGSIFDLWYAMPLIYQFNIVDSIIYNIFPTDNLKDPSALGREIISGRVLISGDVPSPAVGAFVRIVGGGLTAVAGPTNERGVFVFAQAPSRTSFTLTAEVGGHTFPTVAVNTGQSVSHAERVTQSVGNTWDVIILEGADKGPGAGCGVALYPVAFLLACLLMAAASKIRPVKRRRE
ncbi:MAG: C10 family peptidase [Synergistaceae bacterium]|jgi:hypothetical protein|nr:C10 family peptidase [Synergistaceae bacterium]